LGFISRSRTYRITLQPIGKVVRAKEGARLRDVLFEYGGEFPCGGQGQCRGCRIRVHQGRTTLNPAQKERLSRREIEDGWRLACQCAVESDLVIELRQWDAAILSNDTVFAFTPQEGLGVAVDLGTTTLVAQLLDLQNGHVLAVRTALNPQARYGGDVMSRIQFAVGEGGQRCLEEVARRQIGSLIRQLLSAAHMEDRQLRRVVIVGNTVMHYLFCGLDAEPLSRYPFEPEQAGLQTFTSRDLGWQIEGDPRVQFLPCLGSFVGSDLLAGMLATGLHERERLTALVDLGTNGEIVMGSRERILCASTAAGPAFEGARIAMGMRAATGAIWKVQAQDGALVCQTLGNAEPRGVCGSGLVDAVAAGLDLGAILSGGRLAHGKKALMLSPPVAISQADIRQLQLAKGAIAAGMRILLRTWGATPEDVETVYLAGAFGNYVDHASARRIGLVDFPPEKVQPAGNTALLGAKLALFALDGEDRSYPAIRARVEHVSLHADPAFQDIYTEAMGFPAGPLPEPDNMKEGFCSCQRR